MPAADNKGCHFGHHCRRRVSPNSIKHRGKHKLLNNYINLSNLLNRFNGSIRTSMHKDSHPSGGVGSSNPRRWRDERLHHHGDGVCLVICAFCVVLTRDSSVVLVVRTFLRWHKVIHLCLYHTSSTFVRPNNWQANLAQYRCGSGQRKDHYHRQYPLTHEKYC